MNGQKMRTWTTADDKTADAWISQGKRVVVRHTMPLSRWIDASGEIVRVLAKGSHYSEEEFKQMGFRGDYDKYRQGRGFEREGAIILLDSPNRPEFPHAMFFRDNTFTVSPLEDAPATGEDGNENTP